MFRLAAKRCCDFVAVMVALRQVADKHIYINLQADLWCLLLASDVSPIGEVMVCETQSDVCLAASCGF